MGPTISCVQSMAKSSILLRYTSNVNINEVIVFLSDRFPDGATLTDIASVMLCSPQNVSNFLLLDNMMLSKAESIGHAFGYSLLLQYPQKTYFNGYTPQISREYVGNGNLAGLAAYMRDSNISPGLLSRNIGCGEATIRRSLKRGDIPLSLLHKIEVCLNFKIIWAWKKENDGQESN